MTQFDGYLAVDWSASGKPKRGADSIWIAARGWGGTDMPENPATRVEAVTWIETLLARANVAERRLICGFDFPFGYPVGTARMLTGESGWEAVWARIAEVIEDGPDNRNNRFDAAAELNAAFVGEGPFWGNGLMRDIIGLSRTKPSGWGENLPPNRRHAENVAKRAQEVWKLSGAGSVGGQALTGIAALERVRHRVAGRVWPFETLGHGRTHVLAEIYPSLIELGPGSEVKDARHRGTRTTGVRSGPQIGPDSRYECPQPANLRCCYALVDRHIGSEYPYDHHIGQFASSCQETHAPARVFARRSSSLAGRSGSPASSASCRRKSTRHAST